MQQYLDLLRHVKDNGTVRSDRTGIGTKSVFGWQMRFQLLLVFPCLQRRDCIHVHYPRIVMVYKRIQI